ncbi:alpha/beta hydrolase [Micrococcus luteus]|nr:alpha/beta hydrolase [Micrococcus luteus]
MERFTVTHAGVELHGVDSGGALPAVLLLHGLAGRSGEWSPVIDRIRHRFRVVAFDQRGNGLSTRRPDDLSREAHVADVVEVADHLGITELVLVGQSMGAHTAMLTAARHADLVRRLVLVEGGVGGEGAEATEGTIQWFQGWPAPFPSRADAAAFFGGGETGAIWAAGLQRTPAGLMPQFDVDVLRAALSPVHAQARWAEWAALRCLVDLIRGGQGFMRDEEVARMNQLQPTMRVVEVQQAGHDVHLDTPDEVADVLLHER